MTCHSTKSWSANLGAGMTASMWTIAPSDLTSSSATHRRRSSIFSEEILTSSSALLIASGAYLPPELASEFGRLPPAFLPVMNRRLIELQVDEFGGRFDRVFLTLP